MVYKLRQETSRFANQASTADGPLCAASLLLIDKRAPYIYIKRHVTTGRNARMSSVRSAGKRPVLTRALPKTNAKSLYGYITRSRFHSQKMIWFQMDF